MISQSRVHPTNMKTMTQTLSEFIFGDTLVEYRIDPESSCVGLSILPAKLTGRVALPEPSTGLPGHNDERLDPIDSLVQLKIVGDPYTGAFAQGHTMRGGPSCALLSLLDQTVEHGESLITIITRLKHPIGLMVEHRLHYSTGDLAMTVTTDVLNDSEAPITLEMLSSFSLQGISPFDSEDSTDRLLVHRFRSVWSAEGRLDTQSIEQLHLERSWSGAGAFSERFGQVGSMPVRRWFPFAAVEDKIAGVVWGAQLAWAGSWQMEIFRQYDKVALSGGLADREFGHWTKTLSPSEAMSTPTASIACVNGDLDCLCDRLTDLQQGAADSHPAVESDLPAIFNEWCTTWGDPTEQRMLSIADRLAGSDIKFLVIDAGWYKGNEEGANWGNAHGDWVPNRQLFPNGLAATAAAIRSRGLIPGLWFEMETVGSESFAFSLIDLLLSRDGIPITVRERRFWDMTNDDVVRYLTTKVIGLLRDCGFGYLKVDYNETIGIGSEDSSSVGEGLRKHILGVYEFFRQIRRELPDLVIESCSSGGHRLEPSMLGLSAMSSFSDAHELAEIPVLAANLHRLILPRQSQIWAVLQPTDDNQRIVYSLAATFLGRMCVSGGVDLLTAEQWNLVNDATKFYKQAAPIIKHGSSRCFGEIGDSFRHPRGWQAVVRTGLNQKAALVVFHAFADSPDTATIPLPYSGEWSIKNSFGSSNYSIDGGSLLLSVAGSFSGQVLLLSSD